MGNYLSGVVVGFREGLEAFLIVVIMLRFLRENLIGCRNLGMVIGTGKTAEVRALGAGI